ncbi:MAG: exosortase [Rhodopila sp.]|nr:exosortase [Rhodopila sp.]
MNAPVLAKASASVTSVQWRRLVLPLGLGLLLLGALFNKEVVAAVQTWDASTAYNHCFLIIPIALYLLWDRRFDLVGIQARPMPAVVLLGPPLAFAWLVSERLGIMEGRQLIAITFVELLFLAVLGKRLWWAMAGPLLYLYFLVPFGEFLTPKLQDITTWFVRHGLDTLGVPAYIDGYIIEIPQGTFFVAEACAGLRFLIASIAFGCLYALMMYRSPVRRGLFILVSIIVPIIANGFRALGIVYLGYLLNSAQAAAADHVIYGWVFFSAVILILIALGLPFRQDEISTRSGSASDAEPASPFSMRRVVAVAFGVVVVAAISPAVSAALSMGTLTPVPVASVIDVGPGCIVRPGSGASRVRTQRVVCDGVAMDMGWEAFSPRVTAAPVMAERRRLVSRAATEGLSEDWLETRDGAPSAWRIMRSNDPAYLNAVSIWIDGRPVRPGLAMRARMAMDSLFGATHTPMVVTVTPVVDWDALNGSEFKAAEASVQAFLLAHPGLDRAVGALSALR